MHDYKKSAFILFIIILLFETAVAIIGNIHTREPWGDELHFYNTILLFGNGITLDLITHYNEMSTPVPFIMYAWVGKLFGFELFKLRLFSILLAIITYLIFHRILFEKLTNKKLAFYGTLFLVIHPYMVGLSIFVFTDMPAIMFLLIAYYTFEKDKFYLSAVSITLAILCRQYMLFFLPVMFIYILIQNKKNPLIRIITNSILPAIPYLLLVLLWGGTSPDNEFRKLHLSENFSFHVDNFFLYISLLSIYLLPFYFFMIKKFYSNKKILGISFGLSLFYFLFPIQPSIYSQDIGVYTVGLFHKALKLFIFSDTIIQGIFYISVLLGLPVLLTFIKETFESYRKKEINQISFLNLTIILFFLVMPFSYLGWEKYFMPILPFVILRLLIFIKNPSTSSG